MNLVSPGHRSRTETIEGWADIFTRKGSKKRRQAKVKRPQKSTPLCYSVCVCVYLRGLKCIFSWLLGCLLPGTWAVQETSRDLLKRSNCISLCLLSVTTVVSTQESVHRLYCQKLSSNQCIMLFIMFPSHHNFLYPYYECFFPSLASGEGFCTMDQSLKTTQLLTVNTCKSSFIMACLCYWLIDWLIWFNLFRSTDMAEVNYWYVSFVGSCIWEVMPLKLGAKPN